ncbi:MAG: hypothetical protein KY476_16370 [Planctomycetes bacterium]|nr:hypothetical protein [Planctomycetota bacterium]
MLRCLPITILLAVLCASAFSQSEKSKHTGEARKSEKPQPDATAKGPLEPVSFVMTPGREAAALKFAQIHHPELEKLLLSLKKVNEREFDRAVRRLYQDSERLARIRERLPERYEAELEAWQLDSRIRLLVARQTMSDDPELDGKLKELLLKRVELRAEQARHERERLKNRLDKLNETIEQIEADPLDAALKDLERVKHSLGLNPANSKAKPRRPRSDKPPTDPPADQPGGNRSPGEVRR